MKSLWLLMLSVFTVLSLASAQDFELVPIEYFEFDQTLVVPEDLYQVVGDACDQMAVDYIVETDEGILSYVCYYVDRFVEDHEAYVATFDEALLDDGYLFVAEYSEYGDDSDLYMQQWDAGDGTLLELIYTHFDDGLVMLAVTK